MPLDLDNIDITEQYMQEMKEQYPNFKIVEESGKEIGMTHHAKVFLYDKKYKDFDAKFYALLMPASFLGVNLYKNDKFQYAVSTGSGDWKEKLGILEGIVNDIDRKGLHSVGHKFDEDNLGIDAQEF